MESLEAGGMTYSEAARCHQLLTAPGEGLSSRFPASLELPAVGALSAAMVGQRSLASPLVREEADFILGDPDRARALYMNWRTAAARQVIEMFQQVKTTERRL